MFCSISLSPARRLQKIHITKRVVKNDSVGIYWNVSCHVLENCPDVYKSDATESASFTSISLLTNCLLYKNIPFYNRSKTVGNLLKDGWVLRKLMEI